MPSYQYRELSVDLDKKNDVALALSRTLQIPLDSIQNLSIERLSLDSRKRGAPHWSYNVFFDTIKALKPQQGLFKRESKTINDSIVDSVDVSSLIHVIGAGPAGLWATLHLLRRGFQVKLYEQGKPVESRFRDIRRFFSDRRFNPTSNVLFGEGGAGAFSDGKLNTRSRNLFSQTVLEDMVHLGMSKEILYFSKPHIGTNKLVLLLRALRQEIVNLGGEIFFESKLEDIEVTNQQISKIKINNSWLDCDTLVLAPGHSARDLYELLNEKGVALEAKGFAMGVRVEHPQALINERQFGKNVDIDLTGSAEYALTAKTLKDTSSAYSFCMCPGGVLVPCASEQGTLATNGMSHSHRKGPLANGAIVVPVQAGKNLWDGLNHQRRLERIAYEIGEKPYSAPAQSIEAFLNKKRDTLDLPKSTYPCGLTPNNIWDWMDPYICKSLAEGFLSFERKIPGFIKYGTIIAPETRTSSPLRILRNLDTLESVSTKGLFVLGEGAGYAGGIVTSAADGVRFALKAKKATLGVMITKIIDRHHSNMRLDRYLRQSFSTESLSALFAVIRKKKVRVNGVVAKAPLILKEGDLVAIYENLKEDNETSTPQSGWGSSATFCDPTFFKNNFQIALETEDFIIVDKPSGIDSQPGSGTRPKETLVDMLWQWGLNEKHDFKPTLVHRLDKETSGLLMAAIHGDVLRGLTKLIREHRINKHYFALVQGHLEKVKGTITTKLERSDSPQGAKMKTSDSKGKESITHYSVYRRFESMDLVKIKLETGRMHQIRAHFASINHPLAGDSRYGDYSWNRELRKEYGLNRLFLHSFKLEFEWNNQKYNVESKLPQELDQIVRTLSKTTLRIEDF